MTRSTLDPHVVIARAQASYVRCIDEGPLEQWPTFFTEDCRYRITTAKNHRAGLPAGVIWADSRDMLVDRVTALHDANIYEPHTYRHLIGQPAILDDDGERVDSETPFLVIRVTGDGPTELFVTGRYIDRYLVRNDAALLAQRTVVCDSTRIDTLLALPL